MDANEQDMLVAAVVAAAALAPGMASAAIEEFQFNSAIITATSSIDVVGGQAVAAAENCRARIGRVPQR